MEKAEGEFVVCIQYRCISVYTTQKHTHMDAYTVYPSVFLFIYRQSDYMFVYLSVYLSNYLYKHILGISFKIKENIIKTHV